MKYTSKTVVVKFAESPEAALTFKHPGIGAMSMMGDIRSVKDMLRVMQLVYVSGKGVEVDGKDISEVPLEEWPLDMILDLFNRFAAEVGKTSDPSALGDAEKN